MSKLALRYTRHSSFCLATIHSLIKLILLVRRRIFKYLNCANKDDVFSRPPHPNRTTFQNVTFIRSFFFKKKSHKTVTFICSHLSKKLEKRNNFCIQTVIKKFLYFYRQPTFCVLHLLLLSS